MTIQERLRELIINSKVWLRDNGDEFDIKEVDRLAGLVSDFIETEIIGEDEPQPEIPVNDYYWRFRNELRAKQRTTLRGEK